MINDFNQKKKQLLTTYKYKIEIVKKGKLVDDDGYRTDGYTTVFDCWAKINNLYGKELYEAYSIGLETVLNIKIRYCELLKKLFIDDENGSRKYKVRWNNSLYDIVSPDFLGFNKEEVILKVKRST